MNAILNKIILTFGSIIMMLLIYKPIEIIIPMLVIISFTSLMEFFNKDKVSLGFFIVYIILSTINPIFLLGIPVIIYDVIITSFQFTGLLALFPFLANLNSMVLGTQVILISLVIVSSILKYKAVKYEKLHKEYINKRDELTEMSINLESKIKDLLTREDSQVNIATLNERNRISREIHDNVGHLLTSSIIQIGAVMAITKEENTKELLGNIKTTLDLGMNSIRDSIHNLHQDSVDLYLQLSNIIKDFKFCQVDFLYEVSSDMEIKYKYAIIAIVKEALANIIKHSNATKVSIRLYEHPSLYQLIIHDNGTKKTMHTESGMGLEGIKSRVNNLNGIVNFNQEEGFKIFISFMKKQEEQDEHCNR